MKESWGSYFGNFKNFLRIILNLNFSIRTNNLLYTFFVFMTLLLPASFKASLCIWKPLMCFDRSKEIKILDYFIFVLPLAEHIFLALYNDLLHPPRFIVSESWNRTILHVPLVSLLQQNEDLFWNYCSCKSYLRIM